MPERRPSDDPVLADRRWRDVIDRSPDPESAELAVFRLLDAQPQLGPDLLDDQQLRRAVVALGCASRSLSTVLRTDPAALDAVRDHAVLVAERPAWVFGASAHAALDGLNHDAAQGALRRWKRREMVRIAVRDLLGLADLPTVGREMAGLAEASLTIALELAAPRNPFAVIGMGKLGGSELNYSSDVDVLFVHDGDATQATRVARSILATMTTPTADGIVFRTDADLRPEGRAGALSRNVDGYEAWYQRHAQNWEFQALIKARPLAGDRALGHRFFEMTRRFVWRDVLDPDAIREVRAMKARAESELGRKGLLDREVKRGRGGIRDIEFAVQLLQMVHARHDPTIRSPTTLTAITELARGGYIDHDDAAQLADAYVGLRTTEHRLQLWDEQQTHTVPADEEARTRLARLLNFRDRPEETALEAFDAAYRARQAVVRGIHERLFFAPLLETLAGSNGQLTPEAAEARLAAFGFADAAHTRAAVRELTRGFSRTSRVMQQLLPVVLDWLSTTPDPDLGLLQLRRLTENPARAAALATTFRESPGAAQRVCTLLGSSRLLGDALLRQPDFVESLADDEFERECTVAELTTMAFDTIQWRTDEEDRRAGLRRFKRRELLRIATRDVLGLAPIETTARELANLAEACLEAALAALDPGLPFAVIGMGRLGGRELSYGSDVDVLFVYEGDGPEAAAEGERLATRLMAEISATTADGQTFRIDATLRPEGKQGPLARSFGGFAQYYEHYALPWEFQSLLRARPVAGDRDLGQRFMDLVEPLVYRDPYPEADAQEIRRVKVRVERERIPPGEDPQFHLKLAKGALTDIEFTVQLLQLQHGASDPSVRAASTTEAIARLHHAGVLGHDDAETLDAAYRFCERARNARYLVTGRPGDALPSEADATRTARLLGYLQRPQAELRDDFRRLTRHARTVVERVFYGYE